MWIPHLSVAMKTYLKIYPNVDMFSAVSKNEALHSYAFHFSMKNNVKHSYQGRQRQRQRLFIVNFSQ